VVAFDGLPDSPVQFGSFLFDARERLLLRDGEPVPLTPKAFDVLAALVEQPGQLVSKDELLRKVWPDTFVEEANLAYHVFAVRKALGDNVDNGRYIETVPKRGYRFSAPVTWVGRTNGQPQSPGVVAAPVPPVTRSSSRRRVFAALAVVLAAGCVFALRHWRPFRHAEPPQARPLTSLPGVVRAPSLSPDGAYVVFTWTGDRQDNPDLYVQQIGGGPPLRLTTDPGNDHSATWSPDGRSIAFLRRQAGAAESQVRVIAPLGGEDRHVTSIRPRVPHYRPLTMGWCPDAQCLVVTDAPDEGQSDTLFVVQLKTGEKRQLTRPTGLVADVDPAISPDGQTLIFRRNTTPFSGAFYRMSLTGAATAQGEPVRLTSTFAAGRAAWMPDGREVVFGNRGALWKLDVLTGKPASRLPFVGQDGVHPVVARTQAGRERLVYVRSFSDANVWRVETSKAGSPTQSQPVAAVVSTRTDVIPSLSPDGERLAFLSDRTGEAQIWLAKPDGSSAAPLTSMTFTSSPGFPTWSPDGRLVAFHGDPIGRPDVIVVPARGGDPRTLTASMPNGGFPTFSRDSRWIYFCVVRDGEKRIWKMPLEGGGAVQVTSNESTMALESHDGRDLYYVAARERTSSLWRQSLSGGGPVKLLNDVVHGNFDVVERGLYYMATDGPGRATRLEYLEFSTGQSTTVARDLGAVAFGLSASRDGRTIYFSRIDSSVDELMLVDNFR
jgi:Tol biopolymer transport system component/DNA-binding winged helix-turn-helix (wHTH) protein